MSESSEKKAKGSIESESDGGPSSEGSTVGQWEEEDGVELDQEDREVLEDLRELYKVSSSVSFNISSESLHSNNTSFDPDYLKQKVYQLQTNVRMWKECYDLLMNELRKLSLERVVEREEFERKTTEVKASQDQNQRLESELAELKQLLQEGDHRNRELLTELNNLRKERGLKEVKLTSFSDQVNALSRESQQGRLAEEDLRQVISLIEKGLNEGTLKLSELALSSQVVPFEREDVPLGPCTCGPLLEQYKEELEQIRTELKEREEKLKMSKGEVAMLHGAHEQTIATLASHSNKLEEAAQRQASLEKQISKQENEKTTLTLKLQALEEQLDVSKHTEQSLDDSLSSATESLKHIQELTQQQLEIKDHEIAQLKSDLRLLEIDLERRTGEVEEAERHLQELESALQEAHEEGEGLRGELVMEQLRGQELEGATVEKEKLQRELKRKLMELECQVKLTEQYKANLEVMEKMHSGCREDGDRMRNMLISNETELSRMLTALQVTLGRISSLRRRSSDIWPRSPALVYRELSECDDVVAKLEKELEVHQEQWTVLEEAITKDAATIHQLEEELDKKEEAIAEVTRKREEEVEAIRREQEMRENEMVQYINDLKEKLSKTDRLQDALEDEHARYVQVQQLLEEREETLQQLNGTKEFLDRQHKLTIKEVECNQDLVECLQKDLASSQGECDGLARVVADYKEQLQVLTRELAAEQLGNQQDMHTLRSELRRKEEETRDLEERVVKAEKDHAKFLEQFRTLEQCLIDARDKEEREEELIRTRENELNELSKQCSFLEQKVLAFECEQEAKNQSDERWQQEVTQLSAQLEMNEQKVYKLEKELAMKEQEFITFQRQHREEVYSDRQFEETLQRQLAEKREQLLELEHKLGAQHGEIASIQGKLAASDKSRHYLQKRITELELDCERMNVDKVSSEAELAEVRHRLHERTQQHNQLKAELWELTEKLNSVSKEERSSNDELIERIQDLQRQLQAKELECRSLRLKLECDLKQESSPSSAPEGQETTNADMSATDLATTTDVPGGTLAVPNNNDSSLSAVPSSLSISLNVDIINSTTALTPGTTTVSTGTSTVGVASATIPLQFGTQYRQAMEAGLMPTALEDGSHFSETESEAPLDKDYWIHRAGELSVQLQQSSEYWAQKVRELSLDLEKQRETNHQENH